MQWLIWVCEAEVKLDLVEDVTEGRYVLVHSGYAIEVFLSGCEGVFGSVG